MSKIIEAIKAGNKVTTEELFEIVNLYKCTQLDLLIDRKTVMSTGTTGHQRSTL